MTEPIRTDMQELFLSHLFGEARGDFAVAAKLAGYKNTDPMMIAASVEDEIIRRSKRYLSMQSAKAVVKMGDILTNPTELGNKELLAAAQAIIDRVGLVKVERIDANIHSQNGIFILPAKDAD